MNIRQLITVLILVVPGLRCMELEQKEQLAIQKVEQKVAITHFPSYMYYYSAWSNIFERKGLPLGKLSTPSLSCVAEQLQDKNSKIEFMNMCAALLVVEATLLQKPLEKFTPEDIQKINALLLHGINPHEKDDVIIQKWYKPGTFRRDRLWLELYDGAIASLTPSERQGLKNIQAKIDLHDTDGLELKEFLSEEECALYAKAFMPAPPGPAIRGKMQELIDTIKLCCEEKTPLIVIGAYVHTRLTQIHPFCNGNGRTARLLMNCILMKEGNLPFIVIDPVEYTLAIKGADQDLKAMIMYATQKTGVAKDCYSECLYSLKSEINKLDFSTVTFDSNYYCNYSAVRNMFQDTTYFYLKL